MRKILILPKNCQVSDITNLTKQYEIENGSLKVIFDYILVLDYTPQGDDSELVEILDVVDNWHIPIEDIIEECLCYGLTKKEKISNNEYKLIVDDIEYRVYK